MKRILLSIVFISSIIMASAHDFSLAQNDSVKYWKYGGSGSFNFSQGYLKNWIKGGESSISTLTIFNLYANYKKNKSSLENSIDIKYGVIKSGDIDDFRKNEDIIELTSKYGRNATKSWYYSFLFNLKTQGFKGYEYPNDSVEVSDFFAPVYLTFAMGMDLKPSDNFSILLSPVTSKVVYVNDTVRIAPATFGIEAGEKSKKEIGGYMKTQWKWDITKDILLENKLDLFSNYVENPKNIDVNWEVNLTMKINKYINTNISAHFIYDDDVQVPKYDTIDGVETKIGTTKAGQFKQLLSVGFSYKF